MNLSASERKALGILARFKDGIMPGHFAELMWPDSPAWARSINTGRSGSMRGAAIMQAGGAYLAKLAQKGWVRLCWDGGCRQYTLTTEGWNIVEHSTIAGI